MSPRSVLLNVVRCSWIGALTIAAVGCGGDDTKKKDPAPTAPSGLSAAFTSTCAVAGCHPNAGKDPPTNRPYVLSGTSLTKAQFETVVRNGRGSTMPAYTKAVYSDANLASDYEYLSAQ